MEKSSNPFKNFEGKKVLILTKFNIRYLTYNLKVDENSNSVSFSDKFGNQVYLAISEISQIMEAR